MSTNINLLSEKKQQKRDLGKLLIVLYAVFVILFIAAVGLLVYSLGLNSRLDALDNEGEQNIAQIAAYGAEKEDALIINERLSSIQNILSSRSPFDAKIASVLSMLPENFNVNSVNADEDVISLRISSPSLAAFNELIEEQIPLYTADNNNDVKVVEIGSFSQSDAGYTLGLDFYFTAAASARR